MVKLLIFYIKYIMHSHVMIFWNHYKRNTLHVKVQAIMMQNRNVKSNTTQHNKLMNMIIEFDRGKNQIMLHEANRNHYNSNKKFSKI